MQDHEFFLSLLSLRELNLSETWQRFKSKKILEVSDLELLCQNLLLNSEDFVKRELIRSLFEELFGEHLDVRCSLLCFGSTTSGLATLDSDLDFHLRLFHPNTSLPIKFANNDESKKYYNNIAKCCRKTLKEYFNITPILQANVPIIKLECLTSLPKKKLISCDINLTNPYGAYNSIFMNFLCKFSPRFQILATILRQWAKQNELIGYGGMNSYTFTMLIIFFFQNCRIFSPIEQLKLNLHDHVYTTDIEEFKILLNQKCKSIINDEENDSTIFDLLYQFFSFYAEIDFQSYVISPRFGKLVRKDQFLKDIFRQKYQFQMMIGLCVEDPFEIERNISKMVSFNKLFQFIELCCFYKSKNTSDYFKESGKFIQFITKAEKTMVKSVKILMPCISTMMDFFENSTSNGGTQSKNSFIDYYGRKILDSLSKTKENKLETRNNTIKCLNIMVPLENNRIDGLLATIEMEITYKKRGRRYRKIIKNEIDKFPQVQATSQQRSSASKTSQQIIDINEPGPSGFQAKSNLKTGNSTPRNLTTSNSLSQPQNGDSQVKSEIKIIHTKLIKCNYESKNPYLKFDPQFEIDLGKICRCKKGHRNETKEEDKKDHNNRHHLKKSRSKKEAKFEAKKNKNK